MLQIGELEIHLLNESRILQDAGGVFGLVPRPLWAHHYAPDDLHRVHVDHICLLIRTNGQNIVVDTGNGHKLTQKRIDQLALTRPAGTLIDSLWKQGVAPEDVNLVINTHLHGDHCGGNTYLDGEDILPTFPNARYITQRREYADAAFPNERTRGTYFSQNFAPLYESGQLDLIDGELEVVAGIRCVVTPGHTPAHMSIVFQSQGEYGVFIADMAMFAIHFAKLAWMPAFDVEPLVTLETKRYWQQWALLREAVLIFQHDPQIRVGMLGYDERGRLEVQPILEAQY